MKVTFLIRRLPALALLVTISGLPDAVLAGDGCVNSASHADYACSVTCDVCSNSNVQCNYGPSLCSPRGTLFQWSYGTSFSGGPDLDEPLVTDRPDFTEAGSTVGQGVAQIEFGYTYSYNNDGGEIVRSNSFGEPLLRMASWQIGLSSALACFPWRSKRRLLEHRPPRLERKTYTLASRLP